MTESDVPIEDRTYMSHERTDPFAAALATMVVGIAGALVGLGVSAVLAPVLPLPSTLVAILSVLTGFGSAWLFVRYKAGESRD